MKRARFDFPATLSCEYVVREAPGAPTRAILLLHGYTESADRMMRRCESAMPPGALVVAVNAPFQVPVAVADGYRMGYSWYFYDFRTDEYVVGPETSIRMLSALMASLGAAELPVTLVGFSQGGYLASMLAPSLVRCDRVIVIGGEFLVDEMGAGPFRFRCDAIHGAEDDVVVPARARAAHARLLAGGSQGEFVELPGVGHVIDAGALGGMLGRGTEG